jgi:O-succinylbenzoic acid--CoA ligase
MGAMRDWLSQRAATSPDATALVEADTGDSRDYDALDGAVEEVAGRFAALGIGDGDHLGVVLPNGLPFVHVVHAAMRVGATLVPLETRQTPPELSRRIDRADLTTLLCDEGTEALARHAVADADADVPIASVDETDDAEVATIRGVDAREFEPPEWTLDSPLLLMFTSGTTGTPKAVRLTMGNVLSGAVASAFRLGVDPEDRWLVTLSMYHMGGIAPVYRSTLYGTTVVLREGFDPGGAADDVAEHDVTVVSLVPTMLRRMLDSRGTLADSLRAVLLGGAPAPVDLVERCRNYSVPVYPTYGMTEAASQVATATPAEAYADAGTVGRPLFLTDVDVRNADGRAVDEGEVGEFVVSGPTVVDGYYGDEAATAEAFDDCGLWTGDIGYRDGAGRLHVLNRRSDRIVSGGENVDPGEVADALREHPDVRDAAVAGVPNEQWGERVAALVVVEPGVDADDVDFEALEPFLRERLAGYKLPRTLRVVEELPRTVSGTVEREAVRERLVEHAAAERDRAEEGDGGQAEGADGADEADTEGVDRAEADTDGDGTDAGADDADEADGPDDRVEDDAATESGDERDDGGPTVDDAPADAADGSSEPTAAPDDTESTDGPDPDGTESTDGPDPDDTESSDDAAGASADDARD